jgi:predicted DNA-binding transcriptional regulator AlpA
MENAAPKLRRVLREPEVRKALGYKKTQFDEAVKAGVLPQPFKPHENARINLWFEDEIIAHQEARRAARDTRLTSSSTKKVG